jgi:phage terminase small subunit
MVKHTRAISPTKRASKKVRDAAEELTPGQRFFVAELIADPFMSPTEAAKRAGFAESGAGVQGLKLLKNPTIAKLVGDALRERLNRTKIEADDVLNFLYCALNLDPLGVFDVAEDGMLTVKDLHKIPPQMRRLITEIECVTKTTGRTAANPSGDEETRVKVKWVSKELALQLCMKHLGLGGVDTAVKTEVTVNNNLILQLREAVAAKGRVIDGAVINKMASTG